MSEENTLLSKVTSEIHASIEDLPDDTVYGLARARAVALEKHAERMCKRPLLFPVTSAIAIAIAAVVIGIGLSRFDMNGSNTVAILDSDVGVLGANQPLELYENLEFYTWLASTGQEG
ncbi:hypothetical protein [Desulfovibrio inopinatus]|uniref:hypothetical protein n=1 Tax=Desulfovibrio inopinatus TaxID=102109 RepID=UPI0003FAD6E0|nr:hypothetical protein [Desulfovibrio inopinatus]